MKLHELAATEPSKQMSRVFESYFGSHMSFHKLTGPQARKMLTRVRGVLGESRRQPASHHSEKNPAYLKLVMVEQALVSRLNEFAMAPAPGDASVPGARAPATDAAGEIAAQKDPKIKLAMEKAAKGQNLNPDEQKLVAAAALTKTTESLRRAYRMLKESEVQQAQVVLAAQDMVDKMQKMIEDTSSLQFKELPALVDSIKNQVGPEQAQQFNADASAALTGLVQNLQSSKQQMEQALGVVTGQSVAPANDLGGMADAAAGGDPMGDEMDGQLGQMGDIAAPMDDEEIAPAPMAALGRGRR